MDESFRRKLEENGADVEATVRRFMGNEAMYQKFLGRFPADPNYESLGKQIEAQDYEEAFKSAHTLKGVSANLGLNPIFTVVSELVEEIRGKKNEEVDGARVNELWQNVQEVYTKFIDIINEM